MAKATDVLHLFERPTEPVFMPKGDDNVVFDVPDEYLIEHYQPLQSDLANRFGEVKRIPVKRISLPDLTLPLQLGRRDNFSLFLPLHRKMAARLIEIFVGMRSFEDFLSASVYCRDRINPFLFIYALSVAILHRPDTSHLPLPSAAETFPEKYMDSSLFAKAREEATIVPQHKRIPIIIPKDYTANDLEIEHRVAYFREDLGVNLHHWHWHLVYPNDAPKYIVAKDRRGELFYYMHQQIMARYNFERFCNYLGRVRKFNNWREPIEEGYFPKLDSLISTRNWPPRFANTKLRDIYRETEQIKFDIQDLERWRDRIYSAIHSGIIVNDQGESVELSESKGIDILGDIIEASIISANKNLYGDIHNFGHVAIGLCHDPDHRNLETFGVMGDPATAMRDPAFYRWHAFVDDVFQEYKRTLPRYTVEELNFPGVQITGAELYTEGKPKNQLTTFWQESLVDFSRGFDFAPRGPILAQFTHLQHAPFEYKIYINNGSGRNKVGTVRIFIAPKFDERGINMFLRDQRTLFVELDRFIINLKPGNNSILRKSSQSSVTIPFERTFRNLEENRPSGPSQSEFNYCGCGWPQHMLIAKGKSDGFPCDLFVMVSDFHSDKVDQKGPQSCTEAVSYCGIRDNLYPDKRPMGFPFDREPRSGADFLQQFMTPNMRSLDVQIYHKNEVMDRRQKNEQFHFG